MSADAVREAVLLQLYARWKAGGYVESGVPELLAEYETALAKHGQEIVYLRDHYVRRPSTGTTTPDSPYQLRT